MLSRAAHRKPALRRLHAPCEQLALPWLCPALSRARWRSRQIRLTATSASTPAVPPSTQSRTRIGTSSRSRPFATASPEQHDYSTGYIPFEGQDDFGPTMGSPSLSSPWNAQLPFTGSGDREPTSSLIILEDHPCSRSKKPSEETVARGDFKEMLANFDVSLSVGMFDRAATLAKRLARHLPVGSPDLQAIHNKYIQTMVNHMILHRQYGMVDQVEEWFYREMPKAIVRPDALTYGLMLKMSLRMRDGSGRERNVERYWEMVEERGLEEPVIRAPILSEGDLGLLSELCFTTPQALETPKTVQPEPVQESEYTPRPEVRSTQQKGLGLTSLKEALSMFDSEGKPPEPAESEGLSPEEVSKARQRRLEEDSLTSAIERWRREAETRLESGVPTGVEKRLGGLFYDWHQALSSKLQNELELAENSPAQAYLSDDGKNRLECAPFIKVIGAEQAAALTIMVCLNSMCRGGFSKGVKLTNLVMELGKAFQEEYAGIRYRMSLAESQEDEAQREKAVSKLLQKNPTSTLGRKRWRNLVRKFKQSEEPTQWPRGIMVKLGSMLASSLFNCAFVNQRFVHPETKQTHSSKEPAFRHLRNVERSALVGYVQIHESLVEKLGREPAPGFLTKHLPMVSPPRPWMGHRDGGFISNPMDVVRSKESEPTQVRYVRAAAERGDLDEILAGISVLGKTGWKINKPVFDVMLQAWNSGKEVANLAPENPDIQIPEKPEGDSQEELQAYYNKKRAAHNLISAYHSQRCFQNFQMEIARAFLNEDFYLPHNMDFRGRAYPLPPYFNQMGADNCRGLLTFKEGKELGEHGLKWLKVHLANLYGFDKASFDERAQFTEEHFDDICDSAENGLDGRRWWLDAEDPFQCLAACIELRNALKSPEPTRFVSHLPVHQDGSCNGLQHYAALGGDVVGARQVNLEPSDRPSDIYSAVADHVQNSIRKDSETGDKIANILKDKITRKVVKQPVMTNVYGVTFLGATRQVRKQLQDLYPELVTADIISVSSTYITRKIFSALSSMFTGAHGIQFWLGDCANRISRSLSFDQLEQIATEKDTTSEAKAEATKTIKSRKDSSDPSSRLVNPVIWTTPLGLPVVQPYRNAKARLVTTSLQKFSIMDPTSNDLIHRRKQLQGFPPNFIHSLDATHMLLSAIKCDELGLTFSAVHDSFWTHAGSTDTMNRVLRDAFIRMHSDNIIERLRREFMTRYANHIYHAKVSHDSPVAEKIKAHRLAAKRSKTDEVILEYRRLKLLNSENPAEQEEGRQIETPASIFAAEPDADGALVSMSSLGVAGHEPVDAAEADMKKGIADTELEDGRDFAVDSANSVAIDNAPADNVASPPADVALAEATEAGRQLTAEKQKKPKTTKKAHVDVWLPLAFLPVPEKGEFDVARLKDSNYFFS